ncbi:unnamed protein product [Miscanthus lutarioriparius]|uniref:Uncharacterized protein n=1 Tax=Miscanthus lutarioriparius TaxID=422564 RepID=A0A811MZE2_9POAL|nr:unnamed protein product [Miscanthus lutarioriparius]
MQKGKPFIELFRFLIIVDRPKIIIFIRETKVQLVHINVDLFSELSITPIEAFDFSVVDNLVRLFTMVVRSAADAEVEIDAIGDRLDELLSSALPSSSHHPQSQAVAARALRARIDHAVAPPEPLLAAFRRVSALGEEAAPPANPGDAESAVVFVDHVDQLRDAIKEVVARGKEAVRRVEEAVGFLGRAKAAARGGRPRPRPEADRGRRGTARGV